MKSRIFLASILSVFLAIALMMLLNTVMAEKPPATIFTDPLTVQATEIGRTFTININISNVVDLFGWQTGITFNPEVLECTGFSQGEFVKRGGETIFVGHWKDMNNTLGIVYFRGCCLLGSVPGVSGSGQLAYVTFRSVGIGISDFHLTDIILLNPEVEDIKFEVVESFTVQAYAVNYSVELVNNLTGIKDAPNPPLSGTFDLAFSQQDKKISFDALSAEDWFCKVIIPKALLRCDALSDWTIKLDGTPISYTATENGTHASLYFTHGNSTHTVEVIGTEVIKGNPYDLNHDGTVNILDAGILAAAFRSKPGDENWNSIADLNGDEEANILDVGILAGQWGKKLQSSTVSCKQNDIEFSMILEETKIRIGDKADITLTLTNISNENLTIWFGSGQSFDLYLCRGDSTIARWSAGMVFIQLVWDVTLEKGESFSRTLQWNFYKYDPYTGYSPPDPGIYQLLALCVGMIGDSRISIMPGMQIELYS